MQTLHIHDVPDELYNRLCTLAQAEQRTLSDQVIHLLDQALQCEVEVQEQVQLLNSIRRRRFTPPSTAPESVEMIREDRNR